MTESLIQSLDYRRGDGTFVATIKGHPYHIIPEDTELFEEATALAATLGGALPFEPPPPAPVTLTPLVISDRQFFQQLAIMGKITQDEALAAVKTGALPALIQTYIAALPAEQQFSATMLLAGATQFARHHPMTAALAASQGMSPSDTDAFFIAAGAL